MIGAVPVIKHSFDFVLHLLEPFVNLLGLTCHHVASFVKAGVDYNSVSAAVSTAYAGCTRKSILCPQVESGLSQSYSATIFTVCDVKRFHADGARAV